MKKFDEVLIEAMVTNPAFEQLWNEVLHGPRITLYTITNPQQVGNKTEIISPPNLLSSPRQDKRTEFRKDTKEIMKTMMVKKTTPMAKPTKKEAPKTAPKKATGTKSVLHKTPTYYDIRDSRGRFTKFARKSNGRFTRKG
jgi:hypothetical protein